MAVFGRIDQLRRDPHAPTGLTHTALYDMPNLQPLGHLTSVDRLALEGEYGGARHDVERGNLGQVGDDILGNAVAEVLLLRVAAHVGEWQHGDRELRWQGGAHYLGGGRHGGGHAVNLHRLRHVLDAVFAEILK